MRGAAAWRLAWLLRCGCAVPVLSMDRPLLHSAAGVAWRESICVGRTHLADAQAVRSYIEEYAQTEWPGHCYSLTVRPPTPYIRVRVELIGHL